MKAMTSFGFSKAALEAHWYGEDIVQKQRERAVRRHREQYGTAEIVETVRTMPDGGMCFRLTSEVED